jgi:hypothetical protein
MIDANGGCRPIAAEASTLVGDVVSRDSMTRFPAGQSPVKTPEREPGQVEEPEPGIGI